jgi:hypothetical protein
MATISGCRYHKVNLKAKIYIYVKIYIYAKLPPVSLIPVVHLDSRISPRKSRDTVPLSSLCTACCAFLFCCSESSSRASWPSRALIRSMCLTMASLASSISIYTQRRRKYTLQKTIHKSMRVKSYQIMD